MKVLFVCMGNICRSPTAEGVLRHRLAETADHLDVVVDSAGTHGYHAGHPPDSRAVAAAASRGVDLSGIRSRLVVVDDFHTFDLVLAMDRDNLSHLESLCPEERRSCLGLFMHYARDAAVQEVPDPYYGGLNGFEKVLDLVEQAADGLISELESRLIAGREA
jgi:protein-tyrosine phosphatase